MNRLDRLFRLQSWSGLGVVTAHFLCSDVFILEHCIVEHLSRRKIQVLVLCRFLSISYVGEQGGSSRVPCLNDPPPGETPKEPGMNTRKQGEGQVPMHRTPGRTERTGRRRRLRKTSRQRSGPACICPRPGPVPCTSGDGGRRKDAQDADNERGPKKKRRRRVGERGAQRGRAQWQATALPPSAPLPLAAAHMQPRQPFVNCNSSVFSFVSFLGSFFGLFLFSPWRFRGAVVIRQGCVRMLLDSGTLLSGVEVLGQERSTPWIPSASLQDRTGQDG